MKVKFFLQRGLFNGFIQIFARGETHRNGSTVYVRTVPIVWTMPTDEELRNGAETPVQPLLEVDPTDAQQLMDELWHCGLRPSEGTGSAGSLAATERHLNDMRKIVGHALKMDGKF